MTPSSLIARFPLCADLSVRTLRIPGRVLTVLYFENLCDRRFVHDYILYPLTASAHPTSPPEDLITCGALSYPICEEECVTALLNGEAVVMEGERVISVKVQSEIARSVGEPETETVIRGPREGFTERAGVNAGLIRRRIRSVHLKYESLSLGRSTKTLAILMYLDDRVNRAALAELRERLARIDADSILDSGQLELWLQGRICPILPTVGNSERPDKVAAKLLEGRIAIIVDGTPVVLTLPYLFIESLQSSEDYSKNLLDTTLLRLLRITGFGLSVLLPGFFLALLLYHPTAIPSELGQTIAKARESIPFSPFVELLLVLFSFELIREVSIRMPKSVGGAVSLVAALILGDSAVSAGIASAPVIIVVAFSAIGSFLVPPYLNAAIPMRLLFLISARYLGLLGILLPLSGILIHACGKRSFTVPYLAPLSPLTPSSLSDLLAVLPPQFMTRLPRSLTGKSLPRNRMEGADDEQA